jgi:2-oxoglutarate dehydrogenase E1 component
MTPKSLLRLPQAASRTADLTAIGWQPVLDDPQAERLRGEARRVVLCSGKVYYDLLAAREAAGSTAALVRLEQLYRFPAEELRTVLGRYRQLTEVVWAQEEPRNMGSWTFVEPRLRDLLPGSLPLHYVGRPDRASPAEGYPSAHAIEQNRIAGEAVGQ